MSESNFKPKLHSESIQVMQWFTHSWITLHSDLSLPLSLS